MKRFRIAAGAAALILPCLFSSGAAAQALKGARYRGSGFNFCLPRERFQGREQEEFRLFAVSADGRASELRYQGWYNRRGRRPLQR